MKNFLIFKEGSVLIFENIHFFLKDTKKIYPLI